MIRTVATYSFPHEAHIARARLEADGIPAFVADEHTINMQWLYSHALGGVKVQVPESYREEAITSLSQDYSDLLIEQEGEDVWSCPECGSEKVESYTSGKIPAFFLFWLIQFPLWPTKKKFTCKQCGARFREEQLREATRT